MPPVGADACADARAETDAILESDLVAWDREGEIPALPDAVVDQLLAISAIMSAGCDTERLRGFDDDELMRLAELVATQERMVRAHSALIAGEVARRSRPELGLRGMAQSRGHRTPAELMRVTTGSSLAEAKRGVAMGTMLAEADEAERAVEPQAIVDPGTGEVLEVLVPEPVTPARPWMAPVLARVRTGEVSVEQADAIRRGLGEPDRATGDADQDASRITVEQLAAAAGSLAAEARSLDADRLLVRARELRDELDVAGVAVRERRRYEARSLRVFRQADGMSRLVWMMDPETAAVVGEVYDRVTSPKLGGPRFVDAQQHARAERIEGDPRTAEQYASDAFADLLRAGRAADPELLVGEGAPAVRVLVTAAELISGVGAAFLEGQTAPVSLATAERHLCVSGLRQLLFDAEKRPLDLGRTVRLFTRAQRLALHARDGGCRFPGCSRPPSWTEAHHIRHVVRDRGETNIDDGILLCRHHHRLVHDQGWEFRHRVHEGSIRYELIPPSSIDPAQRAIPLPSKSPVYRRLVGG